MKIYILLTYTGTILSKIVKFYTKKEYSHVSIGLDKDLKRLYSFGRKYPRIAFIGGFVEESLDSGTYKLFKNTNCSLYELEVTEEQYKRLEEIIENVKDNKKKYKFNVLGLFMVSINRRRIKENTYYCAEFVQKAMEKAKIDVSYLPEIIKPEDFKQVKGVMKIYSGLLRNYGRKSVTI